MPNRSEGKLEEFAEDLGALLGTATAKAENWLDQRKAIATRLTDIRDTANRMLTALGHQGESVARRGRRSMKRAVSVAEAAVATAREVAPKRRILSAKARRAISLAQKKRWAAHRAAGKK